MKLDPQDFIITRKRKKYKFALFHNSPLCFELEEWLKREKINVLEVGAGTGLFSVSLAAVNGAAKHHVAVDVKADRLQKGAQAARELGLSNVQFLRARIDQLNEYIVPHSVTSIWITFPDPFSRARSAKHRLTHQNFLELYKKWLAPQGALYFKTDAKELFEWSLETLVTHGWQLEELSFDLHESDLPDAYKINTTYERRYMSEGKPIGFVKAFPLTP